MLESKPIRILKTFTPWEIKSLDEYIRSPFFNKNKRVLRAWEIIQAYIPDFDSDRLQKQTFFAEVFDNEVFSQSKLRYLLTDLTKLIEGFLAYKEWENQPEQYQIHLSQAYEKRNLPKDHQETLKKVSKKIYSHSPKNSDDFSTRFQIAEIQYLTSIKNQSRANEADIDLLIESLDRLYLVKKLRYSCELINRANVLNKPYQLFLTEEITAHFPKFPNLNHQLIQLYLITLKTLIEGDKDDYFYQLKENLAKEVDYLDREELRNLYAFALNYCIKKLNTGKGEYGQQIFELYQILVEKKIIFEKGILPVPHFKNTVTIGTRMKAFEWVENFINEYQQYLPLTEAENAYTYNMAYLHFARGNYRKVIRLLSAVEFTDVFYQTDAKTTLIKTYYELEEFEPLLYLLGSFKIYLRRNKKLSDYQRKLYLNLVKVTRYLVRYQLGERITLNQIKSNMEKMPNVAAQAWLKQKVRELEG